MTCIDVTSQNYQLLEEAAGNSISKFRLHAFAQDFYNRNGRLPKFHEIPGFNSEEYFRKKLDVKTTKLGDENYTYVKPENLLEFTGATTLEEALPILNNTFTDLRVTYTYDSNQKPIVMGDGTTSLHIDHMPSQWSDYYNAKDFPTNSEYINVKNKNALWGAIHLLGTNFGIKTFYGTSQEIAARLKKLSDKDKSLNIPADAVMAKGFILNGEIYINSDIADADTPLHEWMHLMFGGIKYQDTLLYQRLVDAANSLDLMTWEKLSMPYYGRTRNDINEEIIVSLWAKYVTGLKSIIQDLPAEVRMDLLRDIQLMLDRILFGKQSARTIEPSKLYTHSLATLQPVLGSSMAVLKPLSSLNATFDAEFVNAVKELDWLHLSDKDKTVTKVAEISRILANKKEKLLEGISVNDTLFKLTEDCQ